MDARSKRRAFGLLAPILAGGLLSWVPAEAQQSDFLFGRPSASFGLRVGVALPRAASDVFDDFQSFLTLEDEDLYSGSFGAELSIPVGERLALALNLSHAGTTTRSEYRDFIDQNDLPIEQDREFSRTPLTVSLKGFLWERGRSIGRFAWVPRSWNAYLGAGAGVMWYRYAVLGDFVDFDTLEIFNSSLVSEGSTSTVHLLAGVEVSLSERFFLTGEGRYQWASAEMDQRQFQGFDQIDLAGFDASVGVSVRF